MISRSEYRGCVKANVLKEDWDTALAQTKTLVQEQKEQNKVLTVCLYQHKICYFCIWKHYRKAFAQRHFLHH